ncbi:MAG TPA: tyrosine-type recombinase/integrase [Verrucomicrobiae bacterium]|jgi:integrase
MSSVHKQEGKPNWFCAFYDPEGYRRFRSTGTEDRRIAVSVSTTIQRLSGLAKQGKLSNEKALKIVREKAAEIEETHGKLPAQSAAKVMQSSSEEFVRIAGGELTGYTVRTWIDAWYKGHTDSSKATQLEYRRIADLFLDHLGKRADSALTTLQESQIEAFKHKLAASVGPSTVNKAIKVLKAALTKAVKKRQLEFSPAQHVDLVKTGDSLRRPFTVAEIKKVLTAADEVWRTMILLAFYSGLRLKDCSRLTWREVDLMSGTIAISTKKKDRFVSVPIAEPLSRHLADIAGDSADAPLCPTLAGKTAGRLSAEFYQIMVKAGLVKCRHYEVTKKGHVGPRKASTISFHSLRHSATSELKSAGVSDSVAMDIIGHETASVSRNYTKIAESAKREAVNKLPDVTV